ncbi:hypothetical protein RHMOL_Rhmol10G0027200 [Rhododendron molle]|uniref:Uncharacterized protein n=1 Tax=Rhododendron molle TaxID=49168 RepID=A0ACC0LZY8_RHOML|nr:hypothetical protein RHMOL_Rhmol10G0027200 [Rhododendron molle]
MSEPKNPLGSNGDQKIGLSSYSPRILLQALDYTGQNFQPFQQMRPNLSDEASCLTVEDKYQAKVDLKKKKKKDDQQPKESKKVYQNYPILVKGQWTPEEDRLLVQLVKLYGERKWSHIAEMLNGRVGKQCRERWHNHLRPDIKKDIWTEEEEMMLIEAHRKIGNKWAAIARKMPGRTENTVKNHWNATKRRRLNAAKRSRCKHSSILHEYIMSLTASDRSPGSEPKNDQMDQATNFDSDHRNHEAVDFGSKAFDEVLPELGREVGFGVMNKEMDLLEMVYQGIF